MSETLPQFLLEHAQKNPDKIALRERNYGIWQAINTANWNLEAHSAEAIDQFWGLGAIAAIPAGKSVIKGDGKIPYLPKALEQRNKNRAEWPEADPEAARQRRPERPCLPSAGSLPASPR